MKTIQHIIDTQGPEAYRSERDRLKGTLADLITAYRASSSPDETLNLLPDIKDTETVIATLVNISAHDGRISNRNKEWAAKMGYSDADARRMGLIGDEIHRAHLEQLASAVQIRVRVTETNAPRKYYGNSEKAPPALKHALIVAHRIMMQYKDKEADPRHGRISFRITSYSVIS